ncbi:hypothetical protein ACFFF5_01865 [Lederbergia wuyishanensis]|uniref:Uncharacterized protein n=1 Tax=Lederbergia wuyishanensis TaxID=1347903 RepID=A0ABU0D0Z3_9BACI|nr:hypothetical protein [Lederbergia wuyishanensis]MCJ8006672.1 hypothetical protein [Lederbergia wuyishanensis]MDQ0342054.1 hypothetical protein [Lederbergia wuyishanensis]
MNYIIENALSLEDGQWMKVSMLVRNQEIRYFGSKSLNHSLIKMDARSFIIMPSFIYFAPDTPDLPFKDFKVYFSDHFVKKGCGTIITNFRISRLNDFEKMLKLRRKTLLNSPIDFLLGVTVPASMLNTSLIIKCKTEKIPIIFVEISRIKELESIPWGWIKDASFPYNPIFIPTFPTSVKAFRQKLLMKKWSSILLNEKIPHLSQPLQLEQPLSTEIIKKIGLYPKKGILKVGGEISYNLYLKSNVEGSYKETDYQSNPSICVQKGKFVSIDGSSIFRPGYGDEIRINKTSLFV